MQIDTRLTPLRLSYLTLQHQLESLARWAVDQTSPLETLQKHQAQLDAYQVSLWSQLLEAIQKDQAPMAYLGLLEQQLGLRRCGHELIELGQLLTTHKVLKPVRKQIRATLSLLQQLFHRLNQGLEKQTSILDIEQELNQLAPPLHALKKLLEKRFKSGQNAPFMLHQYQILWQLQQLEGPIGIVIEGLMTWQLGSPQRLQAMSFLNTLTQQMPQPLHLRPIPYTHSGALIHAVEGADTIIKQGDHDKLRSERKNLKIWRKNWPQLVPEVIDFHRTGQEASLMMQKAAGETLEYWLMQPDPLPFQKGLEQLFDTLSSLWSTPDCAHKTHSSFMPQLIKRLPAILRAHPTFSRPAFNISGQTITELPKLIQQAAQLEKKLPSVCTVPIHGDLNLDNILYDPGTKRITFVDLNRAGKGDYIQELSTLMVSLFRIPNYHPVLRARIAQGMQATYTFAHRIGSNLQDTAIDAHLAFGLARGMLTSTRFIFEPWHARQLFERGDLLLQQLTRLKPKYLNTFTLEEQLFHAESTS